jgi:hypothetical protein
MLKPTRDGGQLVGLSGTRPGPLLRNSIQVRKAGDEHEKARGFVEAELVLHCGAALQGEFAHSLTVTDAFTGWTENVALKNGAHRWAIEAMTQIEDRSPFPLAGLDTDNGGEFINHAQIKWAGDRELFFTRSRLNKSNDNAHVEQKNGDVVCRHRSHYRYDAALASLLEITNPADLTRKITAIQTRLINLAKDKTNAVTASITRAKPAEARTQISRAS